MAGRGDFSSCMKCFTCGRIAPSRYTVDMRASPGVSGSDIRTMKRPALVTNAEPTETPANILFCVAIVDLAFVDTRQVRAGHNSVG